MSRSQPSGLTPTGTISTSTDRRRVVFATVVGTTVEWYDFFIYAQAAGLVFATVFFQPAGPGIALILSFLTVGLSFLFRPLGAFLAGHFGDKYGRKTVLMWTLILMGVATALVGVLPTYAAIGVAAPILLIVLRILQGISAGVEWGGAVLMAVEHAPKKKRGLFGASPQIGVPIGLLLASGMMALMATIAPGDQFLEWGWRIPFLFSVVLIFVGYYIRKRVEESPVFLEIAERRQETKTPIIQLFRKHAVLVIIAAFVFAGNNAAGYMSTGGYIQNYATNPDGPLGLERGPVLLAVTGASVGWLVFTWLSGWLSDIIGRRNTYIFGWIALVPPATGPYQATAAFSCVLWVANSQVSRPPRQNPVTPSRVRSPWLAPAQAAALSRSVSMVASGAFRITSLTILLTSVIFDRSASRAYNSGATAR